MTIREYLQQMGYATVPETFYELMRMWEEWYRGDVRSFHHYTVNNGGRHIQCRRDTLNMAKRVCEDWANLLMNEQVRITLGGENGASAEQEFFDRVAKSNNLRVRLNESQEMKAACGTMAYLPYAADVELNAQTGEPIGGGTVKVMCVPAENIYPLSWENGVINECAFAALHTVGSRETAKTSDFLHVQMHLLEGNRYVIYNSLFGYENGNISPVPLDTIPATANVPDRIETGSEERSFIIDRMAIANNIDCNCPLGISVFANAVGILRGVDLIYDSYNNEFILGKKRIMVSESAVLTDDSGRPAYDANDLVFTQLPGGLGDDPVIREIDMTLRAAEHETALQNRLDLLSAQCGFGVKRYKFDSGSVATATQVVAENSDLFRTLKKHETILEGALTELVRAILRIGRDTLRLPLNPDVEITIDFDDSIIEDKQSDFARDWQMLAGGVLRPEEFRARWMHEDIETARANLPGMAQMDESVVV